MKISKKDGAIAFDNMIFFKGLSEGQFLSYASFSKIELQVSNEYWNTYSLLYAWSNKVPYALSLVFEKGCIQQISIFISHPDETWDDVTEHQICEDSKLLSQLMPDLAIDLRERSLQYSWGKVEQVSDWKNADIPNITISYV